MGALLRLKQQPLSLGRVKTEHCLTISISQDLFVFDSDILTCLRTLGTRLECILYTRNELHMPVERGQITVIRFRSTFEK